MSEQKNNNSYSDYMFEQEQGLYDGYGGKPNGTESLWIFIQSAFYAFWISLVIAAELGGLMIVFFISWIVITSLLYLKLITST